MHGDPVVIKAVNQYHHPQPHRLVVNGSYASPAHGLHTVEQRSVAARVHVLQMSEQCTEVIKAAPHQLSRHGRL